MRPPSARVPRSQLWAAALQWALASPDEVCPSALAWSLPEIQLVCAAGAAERYVDSGQESA